jgi:DNA polymerase-4
MTSTAFCRDCFWKGEAAPANRRCPACASPRIVAHPELARLSIAHMDCDAFYASVEKRDRPELANLPVIVGGGVRGVVTTACYIARTYGPRSAMPMFKARALCPQAVVIKPDFAKYRRESRRIMEKLHRLTPLVQPLSLDEAWMDLSGTEALHGGFPALVLARLQAEIERDVGITVSIGLAPNKFLAKIASDLDKPRGLAVIGAAEAMDFLSQRPVSALPGVGPAFARSLNKAGFVRVGDLAAADAKDLVRRFGSYGLRLHELSHARDPRGVDPDHARKSISAETTFNEDLHRLSDLEDRLWPACEKVATRMRAEGIAGRAVVLKLKTADFRLLTRRRTLAEPIQTARNLFAATRELLRPETTAGLRYRLIGAGLSDLADAEDAAPDLFAGDETRARRTERAVDALRDRFGRGAVVTGRVLRREAEEEDDD